MSDTARFIIDADTLRTEMLDTDGEGTIQPLQCHPCFIAVGSREVPYAIEDMTHRGLIRDHSVEVLISRGGQTADPGLPAYFLNGLAIYLRDESSLVRNPMYDCHAFMHQMTDTAFMDHDWELSWDIFRNPRLDRMAPGQTVTLCNGTSFNARTRKHSAIKIFPDGFISKIGCKGIAATNLQAMMDFYSAKEVFGLVKTYGAGQYAGRPNMQPAFYSYIAGMF